MPYFETRYKSNWEDFMQSAECKITFNFVAKSKSHEVQILRWLGLPWLGPCGDIYSVKNGTNTVCSRIYCSITAHWFRSFPPSTFLVFSQIESTGRANIDTMSKRFIQLWKSFEVGFWQLWRCSRHKGTFPSSFHSIWQCHYVSSFPSSLF